MRLSQWVGKPVKNGTGIGPATVHFSNVAKGRMFHARQTTTGYKLVPNYWSVEYCQFFSYFTKVHGHIVAERFGGNLQTGGKKVGNKCSTRYLNIALNSNKSSLSNAFPSTLFMNCDRLFRKFPSINPRTLLNSAKIQKCKKKVALLALWAKNLGFSRCKIYNEAKKIWHFVPRLNHSLSNVEGIQRHLTGVAAQNDE